MKTTKLVIGIISIILTFVILFQSCAATVGDALVNEGGTSGFVGAAVAVLILTAGIVAIAARNSRGGSIFCIITYALAGVFGVTSHGIFQDLIVWGSISFIFAIILLIGVIKQKKA